MNYEKPISIPGNPIWKIFKRFGRDEGIVLIINVIGTVIEKVDFFPANIWEALKAGKAKYKDIEEEKKANKDVEPEFE